MRRLGQRLPGIEAIDTPAKLCFLTACFNTKIITFLFLVFFTFIRYNQNYLLTCLDTAAGLQLFFQLLFYSKTKIMTKKPSATEFLEDLIAGIVNAWLYHQDAKAGEIDKSEAIKRFSNLSVKAVYELLKSEVFLFYPGAPLTRDMVRERLESLSYKQLEKSYIEDDFMGKTTVVKWLHQKEAEGVVVSNRLAGILCKNIDSLEPIEYITKYSFSYCWGGGESAWKEFVKLRGY